MTAIGFVMLVLGAFGIWLFYDEWTPTVTRWERLSLWTLFWGSAMMTAGISIKLWELMP